MKKIFFLIFFILTLSLYIIKIDAAFSDLEIRGLENINNSEFEIGVDPTTIDWVKDLVIYNNDSNVLINEKLLVDYSLVNFNKPGIYEVTYYLLYLVNNSEERHDIATINIKIIDNTAPILSGVRTLFVLLNQNNVNYLYGVTAYDNDIYSELGIKVFTSSVDITNVGSYNISYYVSDNSGNYTTQTSRVVVCEQLPIDIEEPTITTPTDIYISQNQMEINYLDNVQAYDNTSGDLTNYIQFDDSGVNKTVLGDYPIYFIVFDEVGNFKRVKSTVHVEIDNEGPTFIDLVDKYITINSVYDLKEGVQAIDLVCGDVSSRITVLYEDFDVTKLGSYDVAYKVTDLNNNYNEKTIKVHVVDNVRPDIKGPSAIKLKLNTSVSILDKFIISDNYDNNVTYEIDENNLNIAKIGTYLIKITATDSSNNVAIKYVNVYVYDSNNTIYENPIILGSIVGLSVSFVVTFIGIKYNKKKR